MTKILTLLYSAVSFVFETAMAQNNLNASTNLPAILHLAGGEDPLVPRSSDWYQVSAREASPLVVISTEGQFQDEDPDTRKRRRKELRDQARNQAHARSGLPIVSPRSPLTVTRTILPTDPSMILNHIEVPLQQGYTGHSRVIPSSLADVPCSSFGVEGLLEKLNDVMRQSFTLDMPSISELLDSCISRNYDFGTTYGRLRPSLNSFTSLSTLNKFEEEDRKFRESAVDQSRKQITRQSVSPRRVWDLYSDRVLPFSLVRRDPWAISHSWMDEKHRQYVNTRINANEWPVPIPVDTTLEHVRIELLNMGAEYVWLDVLCLRQEGPPGHESQEHRALRLEEWKIDVPTISHVYHRHRSVVSYFSGLGRPFQIGDLRSPRHWLNRAWTLQEVCEDAGTGGMTPESPVMLRDEEYTDRDAMEFYNRLGSMRVTLQEREGIYRVLSNMRDRYATNLVDKIAGLAFVLGSGTLPIYLPDEPLEDAWNRLLESMNGNFRGDLLFMYPFPGTGRWLWAPTWNQILKNELPSMAGIHLFETVTFLENSNIYRHHGLCVQKCSINGLEQTNSGSDGIRQGTVTVEVDGRSFQTFTVFARHRNPIPDGQHYVLISGKYPSYWIIGRWNETNLFEKVSVLYMKDDSGTKLREFGHWKYVDYI